MVLSVVMLRLAAWLKPGVGFGRSTARRVPSDVLRRISIGRIRNHPPFATLENKKPTTEPASDGGLELCRENCLALRRFLHVSAQLSYTYRDQPRFRVSGPFRSNTRLFQNKMSNTNDLLSSSIFLLNVSSSRLRRPGPDELRLMIN
jgi:hypothetical protein